MTFKYAMQASPTMKQTTFMVKRNLTRLLDFK